MEMFDWPFWDYFRGIRHTRLERKKRVLEPQRQQSQLQGSHVIQKGPQSIFSTPHAYNTPMSLESLELCQKANPQLSEGWRGRKVLPKVWNHSRFVWGKSEITNSGGGALELCTPGYDSPEDFAQVLCADLITDRASAAAAWIRKHWKLKKAPQVSAACSR